MARIRSVHPSFWTSQDIARLQIQTAHHFIGLWNYADDHGRALDDPRLVKAAVWPLRDEVDLDQIEAMQAELEAGGLIVRYTDLTTERERRLFQIINFPVYQRPSKPQRSRYPGPIGMAGDDSTSEFPNHSRNGGAPVDDRSGTALSGNRNRRGIGGEGRVLISRSFRNSETGEMAEAGTGAETEIPPQPDFSEWWERYPADRRVREADARRAWQQITAAGESHEAVAGLDRWVAYWAATAKEPDFIPYPARWLRNRQWTEDPPPVRTGSDFDSELLRVVQHFVEGES